MANQTFMSNPQDVQKTARQMRKMMKEAFSGRINGNFMLDIMSRVLTYEFQSGEIAFYFNLSLTEESLLKSNFDKADYEICRYIIGYHRFRTLFMADEERAKLEKSAEYQNEIVNAIIQEIRLRPFAGSHFRKGPLMAGDEFIFFPIPHNLFAISTDAILLINKKGVPNQFYIALFNNALAALSMLEDNFMDCAYPICRGLIELFLKLLVIKARPEAENAFLQLTQEELNHTITMMNYSESFLSAYEKRKYKSCNSKPDYLHYGWTDQIHDYSEYVKGNNTYSIWGLSTFLHDINPEMNGDLLDGLAKEYKLCNGYAHGNIGTQCKYPLNDYFWIIKILYPIVTKSYEMMCEELGESSLANGIDLLGVLGKDKSLFDEQFGLRTTENFEAYYKKYSMVK